MICLVRLKAGYFFSFCLFIFASFNEQTHKYNSILFTRFVAAAAFHLNKPRKKMRSRAICAKLIDLFANTFSLVDIFILPNDFSTFCVAIREICFAMRLLM